MAKTKKATSKKQELKKFKLSLNLSGQIFKAESDNFYEALEKIYNESFGKVKYWGTFTLETEGKKAELELRPIQIKRAFLGKFAQDLLFKRLTMMLK